jgi:tRNA wybutosine-synthesizing protein 2
MGYQQIGDILIFNKLSKKEAREFLRKFARFRTICARTGTIKGKFRKPQIRVLASKAKKGRTITIHRENGILYKIDVAKLMFAKGNINERPRIAKLARQNEIVVDMFAGIGYFSLPLAKRVKKVYAIELNPVSYHYLLENIKLNKLDNVEAIKGDCAKIVSRLKIRADRIMMGFLPSPFKYLKAAKTAAKKGTAIHYHCLISRNSEQKEIGQMMQKISKILKVKLLKAVFVKNYSPSKKHYVLDLKVSS